VNLADIAGTKRNILKLKLINFILMVRSEYKKLVMGINDFKKCYKPRINIS
jgi:hypothetical protein